MNLITYLAYLDRQTIDQWCKILIRAQSLSSGKVSVSTNFSSKLDRLALQLGVIPIQFLEDATHFVAVCPKDYDIPESVLNLASRLNINIKRYPIIPRPMYKNRLERNPSVGPLNRLTNTNPYSGFSHRDLWQYLEPSIEKYRQSPDVPDYWQLPY